MPRFAANLSMTFTEMEFLDRFAAAAEQGFEAVEYLFPYAYPKVELAAAGSKEMTAFAPATMGEEAGSYRVNFGKLTEGRYEAKVAGAHAG